MSRFKVGQRVRVVKSTSGAFVGREAVITGIPGSGLWPGYECTVSVDGENSPHPSGEFSALFSWLVPLTPPAEDTWASDRVKQVTRVHVEPVVAKTVTPQ